MIKLKIPGKKTGQFQSSFAKGLAGEMKAAREYEKEGYEVLARRAKTPAGEIDLILKAPKANQIVFVEVKQRSTLEAAAYSVQPAQQQRLLKAADTWLSGKAKYAGFRMRFDAVLLTNAGESKRIENAFGLN